MKLNGRQLDCFVKQFFELHKRRVENLHHSTTFLHRHYFWCKTRTNRPKTWSAKTELLGPMSTNTRTQPIAMDIDCLVLVSMDS